MRVMVFGSNPTQHSGMGLVAGQVATGLAKHGHDVHYYGMGVIGGKRRYPPKAPEDEQYWLYGSPNPGQAQALFSQRMGEIDPDVFVTNRNWQSLDWLSGPFNHRFQGTGVSTEIVFYGPPIETEHHPPAFEHRILEDHLNRAWLIPYTEPRFDQYAGDWELDRYTLPESREGAWVPHGVDLETFHPEAYTADHAETDEDPEDLPGLREGLGIGDRYLGVFIGENWRRKNLDLLFDAWRGFRDRVIDAGGERPLLLVHSDPTASRGDDQFYSGWNLQLTALSYNLDFAESAARLDEADVFTTKEYVGDFQPREVVAGYLAPADVYVLPTAGEGFSLTSLEAMATGTPIVQTDLPTLRWLCGDQAAKYVDTVQQHALNTGERHWTPSVEDLTQQLFNAWANQGWREDAAEAGRERAEEFPWSRMHDGLADAVEFVHDLEVKF